MSPPKNEQLLFPASERDNLLDQIAKKEIFSILEILRQHHQQYNIQVMVSKKKSASPSESKVILNLIENIKDFEYVNSLYLQAEKRITIPPHFRFSLEGFHVSIIRYQLSD